MRGSLVGATMSDSGLAFLDEVDANDTTDTSSLFGEGGYVTGLMTSAWPSANGISMEACRACELLECDASVPA